MFNVQQSGPMKTCQNKSGLRSSLRLFTFLTGLMFFGIRAEAKEVIYYVATNGNNVSSGIKAAPFATLPGALKAARVAREKDALTDVKILLRGGTYELEEPIVIKPEDSGSSSNHSLLIAAYKNEQPVISGGHRITNWKKVAGKPGWWTTEIPAVREGKWHFNQLFINGRRKQRARTPNKGYFTIEGASPQSKPVSFHFHAGELKPEWAASGDVEVVALPAWAEFRMNIRAVDETNHVVTLSGNAQPYNQESNARYYIENTPDALDEPGEWYLDKKSGVLTCIAEAGEDLNNEEVTAPNLTELLRFEGDITKQIPVHDIRIEGIHFAHADWQLPANGYADTQGASDIAAAVHGEGVQSCVIKNCVFEHLGGYALEFGKGSQNLLIEGNEIVDIGAGGIRLGPPNGGANTFEKCDHDVVTDNHIHELGRVYPAGVGILVMPAANMLIAHNHIHDLFYTAISVGWSWGYDYTPCHDNIIEFNHLYDIGQGMLSDMGGIYTLGIQKGTVLRNNLIHDVNCHGYGAWGLYTDEGSSYIVLENNVVYHCKSAGFHQHYGRENILRNNIFAFNGEAELARTRMEPHLSFSFTNNIVYFDTGELLGGNWSDEQFKMDDNLYFDTRRTNGADTLKFAGMYFADWQKHGHDPHSLIANPIFVAPSDHDFRLKRDSPAFRLGFKQIDMSGVGVRKERDRR